MSNHPSVAPGGWAQRLGWRTGHSALLREACLRLPACCRRPACLRGLPALEAGQQPPAGSCQAGSRHSVRALSPPAAAPCPHLSCVAASNSSASSTSDAAASSVTICTAQHSRPSAARRTGWQQERSQQGSKRTRGVQQAQTCSGPAACSAMPAARPCAWLNARPNSACHSSGDRGGAV